MSEPTKPTKMKPVKAWAVVSAKGRFVEGSFNKQIVKLRNPGFYRIARVLITEVPR